jgi:hypothetical protein
MKNEVLRKSEEAVQRLMQFAVVRHGWKIIRNRYFRKQVESALRQPLPPVLVYQMAKVASRGIADALLGRHDLSVLHFHFTDPDNSAYMHRQLFGAKGLQQHGPTDPMVMTALNRRWQRFLTSQQRGPSDSEVMGRAIHERLIKPGHKAFVITLVREPIARNISSYFHHLNIIWRQRDAHANVPFDRLVEGFLSYPLSAVPLEWFDREFKAALSIDIYEHPFPREQGFMRLSTDHYEVLVMRHDLDDRQKERCIQELLGVQDVAIRPVNTAAEKPYAEVYRHFVETVRLPESYISEMLDSKYTRHFYTSEEIERLRAKWLRIENQITSPQTSPGSSP